MWRYGSAQSIPGKGFRFERAHPHTAPKIHRTHWIEAAPHPVPLPIGWGEKQGSEPRPGFITAQPDGVTLAIQLQPRASKNEIGEPHGPELRIRVTAPPVDAAANEALIRLLADTLDCPRGKVELIRGHTAQHKIVRIHGATPAAIMAKLGA